jgi:NAD(P)-dependent dehydrogenase (short-subunit alcohol dehydrogenase family)
LVGRREDRLRETARALPGSSVVLAGDVSDPARAAAIVADVVERFGRLDNLVNCAGIAPIYPIDETTPQRLAEVFRVNTLGTGHLIAAAWPTFVAQRSGCIVNISSMATADPFPGFFAYAASKAAVELMALSCAKEGMEHGIRAFAVAPGAVETDLLRTIVSKEDWPTEQCLTADQVAAEIAACTTGERDDRNGQTIRLPNP